ncbi:serine hydrolase [Kineococcus sp. R8]|uniref:serine hydrolase n=1 Tax=Kineococcus siccus TaxID=2696567 RepID=UPI001412796F|nr:serine hydrolase [Kineococcus siccus]
MTTPPLTHDVVAAAARYADTWIALRARGQRVPGVQVAVRLAGDLVLSSAHGTADVRSGEPLTPQHVFRVASHSKTFTATAVLLLAEQGRLRLDDAVGAHLPWVAEADDELGRASLRELLAHAAGVTRDGPAGDFWCLDGEFLDTAGLRAAVTAGGSLLPRSSRFKYSNIGYSLLGAVIEAVAGTSYAEHVTQHLIAPLGLGRTTPELDPARGDALATGHTSITTAGARRPLSVADTRAMAAATGFCSTAEDLTAWFSAHCPASPEALLDEHSLRLAQHPGWAVEGSDRQYGLGLVVQRVGARTLVGHSGGFPGHITQSLLDPGARLAVSVLTNCIDGPASELALGTVRIVDLFAEHWREETGVDDLDAFCGRWASPWGVLDVVRCGTALLALHPEREDPAAVVTRLQVLDGERLRVVQDSGFGDHGETWALGRDDDGTPTLRAHSGSRLRPLARVLAAAAARDDA